MKRWSVVVLWGAVSLSCRSMGAGAPAGSDLEFYDPPTLGSRKLPFSEAVRVGNLLFLAGKIGRAPGTRELAPGGIQGETQQALENIREVLERRGSSMDRVVKCTVFLADIREWAAMNEVYVRFFPNNPPARSVMGVGGLALGARVEIECIAVVKWAVRAKMPTGDQGPW